MAARASQESSKDKAWFNHDDWSSDFAEEAWKRFEAFQERLKGSKRHHRIRRMWQTVYMRDRQGACDTTEIGSAGRRGEVLLIQPNRMGRLLRDHLTLVEQTKALPDPKAATSDPEAQDQVALGKGICEHYKRESDLEQIKSEHAWVAEICGDSYLHVPWDPDAGNEVAVMDVEQDSAVEEESEPVDNADEEDTERATQRIVYEGDFKFAVRTPYDVAYDRTSPERKKPRWWIVKEPVNRFDLLAQVREEVQDKKRLQELEHAIKSAPRYTDELQKLDYDKDQDLYDDSIGIFYIYVEECRARPAGRFAKTIDKKTVLYDGPLGEPRCPVFRLSQGEVLFRNEATSPNHDGLPLADALGAQLSTLVSNNANYGLTRVVSPRKANVEQTALDAGAAVVEYDHVDKSGNPIPPPSPWSALDNNPQLYQFYELLCSELDLVIGGSPVTRGDPNATQGDSGSKVAALFAAAQNIGSSFVGDVLRCWEEVFTFLIDSLKIHATTKRVINIVGENNSYQAREYTKEKLTKIIRITVEQADVMRDTVQGRMAMAEMLKDKTPEQQKQIIAGMKTGRWEPMDDPTEKPRMLLERENEALRNPELDEPIAVVSDPHVEHIKSHEMQKCDPAVRADKNLMARIDAHNIEHLTFLAPQPPPSPPGMPPMPPPPPMKPGSPEYINAMLHVTGQAPLPPMAPPPGPPEEQAGPNAGPSATQPGGGNGGPPKKPSNGMPKQPSMPTNPITGDQMNAGGPGPGKPAASPVMG